MLNKGLLARGWFLRQSCYVAQADLKLTMKLRLILNSESSSCLSLIQFCVYRFIPIVNIFMLNKMIQFLSSYLIDMKLFFPIPVNTPKC